MSDDIDDLDALLGDMDDDFDSAPSSGVETNDRKAITKAMSGAASSAFSRILPKRKKKEVILKALPKNYTDAADNIQDIQYTAEDLYSHTKEELLETKRLMKRKTQVMMPTLRKYLPTPVAERVNSWSDDGEGRVRAAYDEEQAKIDSAAASVFGATQESVVPNSSPADKRASKDEAEEELKERTEKEIKQFASDSRELDLLESTRRTEQGVLAILKQEQTIGTSWKRKTLEVGMRQMFALQEIATLIKYQNDTNIPNMEAIVKNTALPDYAKEEFSEVAQAMMQRKIIESLNPMEYSKNFLSRFAENAKSKVSETLGEVRGLMDMVDSASDNDFDEDGSEVSDDQRKKNVRDLTTNQLAGWIAEKIAVPVRDKVLSSTRKAAEGNDEIVEFGEKLKYYSGNLAQIYNTELTDETEDSVLKTIVGYLEEIQGGYGGEVTRLQNRDESWLNEASKDDNRKYVTITEVIPAWLARISGGIDKLNGEETNEDYDIQSRGFVSRDTINDRVRDNVGLQDKKVMLKEGLDDLVKSFDPESKMSDAGRKELRDYFYDRVRKNRTFDIKSLSENPGMTRVVSDVDDEELFQERIQQLAGDKLHGNMNKYARKFNGLRSQASGYQRAVNQMTGLYGDKALVDAGIFSADENGSLKVDESLFDLDNDIGRTSDAQTSTVEKATQGVMPNTKANNSWIKQQREEPRETPEEPTGTIASYFKRISQGLSDVVESIKGVSASKPSVEGTKTTDRQVDYSSKLDVIIALLKRNAEGVEETKRTLAGVMAKGPGDGKGKRSSFFSGWFSKKKNQEAKEGEEESEEGGRFSNAMGRLRGLGGFATKGLGSGFDVLRSGARGVEAFVKNAVGAKDVYNASGEVVLSGTKLEKGLYYSMVGGKLTQIFKLEDIKGAVYDADGRVILSEEDLANAGELTYYKDKRWFKLTEVIGGGVGSSVNKVMGGFGAGGNFAQRLASNAIAGVFGYPDIYVKGESTPRLRADFMRKGHYRLNAADGPIVKSPTDIKGPVYDINNKLIISEDELASPNFELVDQDGNPIKTRFQRFNRGVANQHKRVKNFIGRRLTGAKNFILGKKGEEGEEEKEGFFSRQRNRIKSFWKGDASKDTEKRKGVLSRLFGRAKDATMGNSDEYDVLVKIYNLLNQRMPGEPGDDIIPGIKPTSKVKSTIKAKVDEYREKQTAKPKEERGIKAALKRRLDKLKSKGEEKLDEVKETESFKKARDKVEEVAEGTASKRRFARMKANKAKRGFMSRLSRGRRLTELKAKRAKRSYERDRATLGESAAVINAGREEVYNPAKKFIINNVQKAKRKFEEKTTGPMDQKKSNKPKVGVADPQMALLKRIADSSEAGWIKSIAESTDDYGMDQGFKRRTIGNFAKRFKGGMSRFYKDYARKDTNDFGEESIDPKDPKAMKTDKDGKPQGMMSKMLSGVLGGIGNLGDWIKGILAAKLGGGLLTGGLKKGAKSLLTNGAKKVAGFVAGQGLRTAGAALLSGAASVVGGLSLPVVAGVAAVGAVGWFAYRKLTSKDPSPLGRVRLAQYGVRDYDNWNSEDATKIRYLEDNLKSLVAITPDGATLRGLSAEKAGELAIGYGIDKDNQLEVNAWHSWFQGRFIPIYLLWQGRVASTDTTLKLSQLEDQQPSPEVQLEILNGVRLPPSHPIFNDRADPLKADRGMFKSMTDWMGFTEQNLLSGEEVGDVTARAILELQGKVKSNKEKAKKAKNVKEGTAKFNAGMAKAAPKKTVVDSPMAQEALKKMHGGDKPTKNFFPGMDPTVAEKAVKKKTEETKKVLVPSTSQPGIPKTVEMIRFAMYGFDSPTDVTLESLRSLDKMAVEHVDIKASKISSEFYVEAKTLAAGFGVPTWSSALSKDSMAFYNSWLRDRYIPVYIAYNKALGNTVGLGSVLNPMPSDEVYRAMKALSGAKVFSPLGPVSILSQPMGVDKVGKYELVKDTGEIDRLIESIKPPEKRSMASATKDGIDKKLKKSYLDGVTHKERSEKNKSVFAQTRQRDVDNAKSQYQASIAKGQNGGSSQATLAPKMDPASVKSDLGTGQYAAFASTPLRSRNDVATLVGRIAEAQGVDPNLMITTAMIESSLNPQAAAKTSSAKGLFQFINRTWDEVMREHGNRLGIPEGTKATDPVASALLASEYFRANGKIINSKVNRDLTAADYYMGHFLGAGGASKFFKGMETNPGQSAAKLMPSAAKANQHVFYDSSTGKSRSLSEVYDLFTNKFISRGSQISSLTGGEFSSSGGVSIGLPSRAPIDDSVRKEEAIVSKAKRDSDKSKNIRAGYRAVTPTGNEFELQSTAKTKEFVATQTETVSKEQPQMQASDKERYATALAEVESGVEPSQPKRENVLFDKWFKSAETYQSTDVEIQNKQLETQLRIVEILGYINEKFGLALDSMGTKIPTAMDVKENADEARFSRQRITVDLSNTQTDVRRNKMA